MIYFTLLLCLGCVFTRAFDKMNVVYEWKYVDFVWINSYQKNMAINSGNYISTNCFPYDTDQAPDGRIFVTVVKDAGVPATLTTVSNIYGDGGPLLQPYPNWSWNQRNDCRGITGVYRISIVRNRLYVLDTGKTGDTQVCPAQLLIFDLWNDSLVKRVVIPSKYSTNTNGTGLLVTPIVEVLGPHPDHINVYMADTEGYGLVIWDGTNFIRIESKSFVPASCAMHFKIGNDSFDLPDGLLGMAITLDEPNAFNRLLYFRPLASFYMYHVESTELHSLKDKQSAIRYIREPNKMRSQSVAQAFSRNGILFFSSITDKSLICWNRHKTFNYENTVQFAINEETLQFASGIKVVPRRRWEKLLVMTNRYQKIANNNVNFTDVNFRILEGIVDDIVRGTNCE